MICHDVSVLVCKGSTFVNVSVTAAEPSVKNINIKSDDANTPAKPLKTSKEHENRAEMERQSRGRVRKMEQRRKALVDDEVL